MYRKSIPVLALTLLAVLALVAAGCGGGKKKNAAETTTAAVTTTGATTTEATTTEATTTEVTTTKATKTTPNLSGFASSKNCRDLGGLTQKLSATFSGSASGTDIKSQAALFKQFADKAPSEVRSDFQTVATFISGYAEAVGNLKAGQRPDAATATKLQKFIAQVDQAKVLQAEQHITAWVQKNCHA
jgi:hypothetical protein